MLQARRRWLMSKEEGEVEEKGCKRDPLMTKMLSKALSFAELG
jgi:hypothetical protein